MKHAVIITVLIMTSIAGVAAEPTTQDIPRADVERAMLRMRERQSSRNAAATQPGGELERLREENTKLIRAVAELQTRLLSADAENEKLRSRLASTAGTPGKPGMELVGKLPKVAPSNDGPGLYSATYISFVTGLTYTDVYKAESFPDAVRQLVNQRLPIRVRYDREGLERWDEMIRKLSPKEAKDYEQAHKGTVPQP